MSAAEKLDYTKMDDAKVIISAEAVRALTDAGGSLLKAVDIFADRVRKNRDLRDALTEPLIRTACYEALRQIHRSRREAIWHMPQPSADKEASRVISLAGGTIASLLDFPLPGGKPLRDATGAEITAAADFYHLQASDMTFKARWLRLVGQAVPHDEIAGKHVSEAELNRIREEATNA